MDYDGRRIKILPWNEYQRLHNWVRRTKGQPTFCSDDRTHTNMKYHWANISQEYRWDLDDFRSLCQSCNIREGITEETRQKFSRRSMGNNNAGKSVIKIYSTGNWIKFSSGRQAARETGISATSINNVLKGISKTAGGFKWKYEEV